MTNAIKKYIHENIATMTLGLLTCGGNTVTNNDLVKAASREMNANRKKDTKKSSLKNQMVTA